MADGHFSRLRKGIVNGLAQEQQQFASVLYEGPYPFQEGYVSSAVTDDALLFFNKLTKKDIRISVLVDRATCGDLREYLLSLTPYLPGKRNSIYFQN